MAIKKRTKKVSKGENGGGGKVRLTEIQKALLNKGVMDRMDALSTDRWQKKYKRRAEEAN